MYTSYEVGVTKPDAAIFDRMIENAPLIPAETLFGQGLGFHTYQPENGEDWREAVLNILAK